MNKILNTWQSQKDKLIYYELDKPIYINGDWSAYKYVNSVIYCYKNIAVNNLVKFDKLHIDNLANNTRPLEEYNSFLFDRAIENKKRGLLLLNN